MIDKTEIALLENFAYDELPEKDFLSRYPIDLASNKNHLIILINETTEQKDSENLELLLDVTAMLEMYQDFDFQPIYRDLIKEDWHKMHESLVDSLDKTLPNEDSFIYVLNKVFDYHAEGIEDFMVPIWSKCLWNLYKIGSDKGVTVIKEFVDSEFHYLRDTSRKLLQKSVHP